MSDNPLVNIGDLAKPATALIEKIAGAGHILYEPRHIREVAKAKAEAAEIAAESQIKITDLHKRAARRWIEEEAQRQKNMEDTTTKAISQLNEDANPHDIDDDWITKFFDKCRLVSDDKMQDLWASVLAGEANRAGSYSPKALTTLADMDQKVATLFNTFCSLCLVGLKDPNAFLKSLSDFEISDARVPIIRDTPTDVAATPAYPARRPSESAQISAAIYQRYGFGIDEFQLLSEYGLVLDSTLIEYSHFWYNNEMWGILKQGSTETDSQKIRISGYCLSSVGKELFHITKRGNPPEYLESLIDFLKEYYDVKMYRFPKPQPSAQ